MKYSIAIAPQASAGYPAIYREDLFESVKKARGLGYAGIEWHLRRPDMHEAEKLKRLSEDLRMPVTSIGTGLSCVIDGLTLMHTDREVRIQAVERLKEFIDLGRMLESVIIIGSMKGKIPTDGDTAKFRTYLAESLDAVLDCAEQKAVTVVLEVLNRYESNLLNTCGQMQDFVQQIKSLRLKTHIDTFHMNIEEADNIKSIETCRDTLGHVHFSDSNRCCPGTGHIDFKPIVQKLGEIDYTGCIAVECLSFPDPDTAAKRAIAYLSSF
jgi:sugar phosphate isomerase/epimerase